jgi:hypothetical protein
LLVKEKAFTLFRDALAAQYRRIPWMKVRILSLELDLTPDRKLTANVEADQITVGGTAW